MKLFTVYAIGAVVTYAFVAIVSHSFADPDDPPPWRCALLFGLLWPMFIVAWALT